MKKRNLYIGLALLTLGVTSCKEDYFDADAYKDLVKKTFPVKNVDENHTWATMGTASVKVTVKQPGSETYKVRIYDGNPIGNTSGLTLLGQGTVVNGQSLETAISYPLATPYAYVALYDSKNYMSVYPTAIQNGKLETTIGDSRPSAARAFPTKIKAHDYDFPDMPSADKFATAIPGDAKNEDLYYETQSGNFFVTESDTQINVWMGNANLYFAKGTYNISKVDVNNNTNIYLLPGANVTMPLVFQNKDINIYIAEGATLNGDVNAVAHFYNRGAIVSNSFNIYSVVSNQYYTNPNADNGILINNGTITVSGEYHVDDYSQTVNNYLMQVGTLTIDEEAQFLNTNSLQVASEIGVKNANSLFINTGNATAGSVGVEGSADFYNESGATITVSGETVVNSNQCTWHNDGTYTTENFTYEAGSIDVINNCKLIVNDRFYLGLGDTSNNCFQVNGGGSVVTTDFEFFGPGYLVLGSGSLFQVTGTAYMAITKDNYGIYGPADDDYAVFQAKEIVRGSDVDPNQGFVANYFGHLYVATDSHFDFGYSDKSAEQQANGEIGSQPYYRLDAETGATMVTYNGANVEFTDNGCGSAYNGEPEEEEVPSEPMAYVYCFEDNYPQVGDYDFNDAVFTVTPTINGKEVTLTISLDAVGAREQLAAALRIKGLLSRDVASITMDGSFDSGLPSNAGSFDIISGEEGLVDNTVLSEDATDALVLKITNNVHWAIGRKVGTDGMVQNWFYNTVERTDEYPYKDYVESQSVTYHLTMLTEDDAKMFVQENMDFFIVESFNGGWWEVHTVPFKYEQVLNNTITSSNSDYEELSENYPWAICVPKTFMVDGEKSSFKYPIEWQNIGFMEDNVITGAYQGTSGELGHSFAEWAVNHENATDWYKYPTEGLVFE